MQSLTVFFGEPAPVITPAIGIIFAPLGGLDLLQPVKWHRFGMNICEDYVGFPAKAPKDMTFAGVYEVAVALAAHFGVAPAKPEDQSDGGLYWAVSRTVRAIAEKNRGESLEGLMFGVDMDFDDPDEMLFRLCGDIQDGNNVANYQMQVGTQA